MASIVPDENSNCLIKKQPDIRTYATCVIVGNDQNRDEEEKENNKK